MLNTDIMKMVQKELQGNADLPKPTGADSSQKRETNSGLIHIL